MLRGGVHAATRATLSIVCERAEAVSWWWPLPSSPPCGLYHRSGSSGPSRRSSRSSHLPPSLCGRTGGSPCRMRRVASYGLDELPRMGWKSCLGWVERVASYGLEELPRMGWKGCLVWVGRVAELGLERCVALASLPPHIYGLHSFYGRRRCATKRHQVAPRYECARSSVSRVHVPSLLLPPYLAGPSAGS